MRTNYVIISLDELLFIEPETVSFCVQFLTQFFCFAHMCLACFDKTAITIRLNFFIKVIYVHEFVEIIEKLCQDFVITSQIDQVTWNRVTFMHEITRIFFDDLVEIHLKS